MEYLIMESLSNRMKFSKSEEEQYFAIKKGYEGEVLFDSYYENCPENWLILNDLWLKSNNSIFQIDSLLITSTAHYIFEVKNLTYEYLLKNNRFYRNGNELKHNPLTQLERCDSLYRHLLKQLGYNVPVISNLAFVNPDFTLFGTTEDHPILLPTQIKLFFEKLKRKEWNASGSTPSTRKTTARGIVTTLVPDIGSGSGAEQMKPTQTQIKLAKHLLSILIDKPPLSNIPSYDFETLEKGLLCLNCRTFLAGPSKYKEHIVCHHCGHVENTRKCILNAIKEYQLLFPNEKLKTDRIFKWCKVIICQRKIRRVLLEHYFKEGNTNTSFYSDFLKVANQRI
ncbi:nuclease-related domain-containing protein [Evansella tamaricis]|uniref:NERD domain-containing protein n=1 Tax=Evansella tamaricis TaxID=2069301 RepID=A0ABS6JMJ5_9BACI|nr:nuclease-related domain-containing protein [Evansella tamaricis]MBU9714585.1 NERD domain-containing protein [Evansella tamaricis]